MRRALQMVVVCVVVVGCTSNSPDPPKKRRLSTTITLPPPNASGVALPIAVGITTTTRLAILGGSASVGGRATDTTGAPAAGAVVHLERLVGDDIATTDVGVAADGRWKAAGLRGGRYRLRSWRVPDLAMTTNDIFFLAGNENRTSNLTLNRYDQRSTSIAAAPSPLIYNQAANVALRVNRRTVDAAGIVGGSGESGLLLTLTPSAGISLESSAATTTNGSGQGLWRVRCTSTGSSSVTVVFGTGETQVFALPACVIPAPPTTELTTETTLDSSPVVTTLP